MDLIRRVWALPIDSEPWRAGYIWLGWGVIGGLLPLWGTAIVLLLFGQSISLYGLLKNGEFVLYAASFAGGAMYVISRDIFPSRNALNFLLVLLLLISLSVFVAITVISVSNKPEWLNIKENALTWISIIVIVATTLLCFLITIAEASGFGFDVPAALKRDEKKLEKDLDQLLKKSAHEGGD